ncbi:hypothetical protein ASG37_15780 [Sphingomonas sp. Leaf407]|uniref:hypothetical protein n=1 Tax=unclassified Sphingomonas TaxID=196159 RepID=UPI0006F3F332|nr:MULTISPECIES: hypothetical protein [unclassified Sphingomonas]KQN34779.1 hypothetical protein ASE97_15035 [Sphingomonas sp. Leaf42]KQT25332.1 hypothetical protein ASG37_15780 [Sphingomonas sp. Leaf407]
MAKPFPINVDVQPNPANPHSWLPLMGHSPGESGPGGVRVMWGVLRPEYRSFSPSLSTFVRMKLAPAAGANATPWAITAYRYEVLLPAFASDHLRDPRLLIEAAEREQPADAKALAAYVTLTSSPDRLHAAWEIGRTLAKNLVDDHDVAALLVQHVPSLAGGSAQPHLHLVIPGPRRVTRYGMFSTLVGDLAGDRGRDLVLTLLAGIVGETSA